MFIYQASNIYSRVFNYQVKYLCIEWLLLSKTVIVWLVIWSIWLTFYEVGQTLSLIILWTGQVSILLVLYQYSNLIEIKKKRRFGTLFIHTWMYSKTALTWFFFTFHMYMCTQTLDSKRTIFLVCTHFVH